MRITLEEFGGLAAAVPRAPLVIEAHALAAAEAGELARLAAAARAAPAPPAPSAQLRDAMGYAITIEDAGRTVTLEQSDGNLSPAFADLLAWLKQHGDAG